MKILVVTTDRDCPAVAALQMEGLLGYTEVVIAQSEYAYGEAFTRFWHEKEQFINIEHDIVPWPGAIEQLWNCHYKRHLCTFGYQGAPEGSLGLTRFSRWIIEEFSAVGWPTTLWHQLDGAIGNRILPYISKHQHHPWVAHLTHLKSLYPYPESKDRSKCTIEMLAGKYGRPTHDVRNALAEIKVHIDENDQIKVSEAFEVDWKLRRLLGESPSL